MAGIFFGLIIDAFCNSFSRSIFKHVDYLLDYERNIEQLKDEEDKLMAVMMDVELLVSQAERYGEPIKKQVEYWLRRAKNIVTEAQKLGDEEPNLNPKRRRVSRVTYFTEFPVRYRKSVDAVTIAEQMGVIRREHNFESVSLPLSGGGGSKDGKRNTMDSSPSASGARFGGDEELPGGGGSKDGERNTMDSSSTNTEPTSNTSPYGKFKRGITHWERIGELGRGSFGTVYKGMSNYGFFFAVKEVSLLDQGSQGKQKVSCLEQEIALLRQFEHENIVQYYGTNKDESNIYIFLELVTQGSLAKLYERHHLEDSQVSEYTRQILHGLKYLHDRNVIHRDIKCANILVEANGTVKLADFGLAKAIKFNDVKSCKGTPLWMAPEVVNMKYGGYGLPADIWSLGCTVLEMLNRKIPYSGMEGNAALFKIGKGQAPHIPESLPEDARNFILWCLQANPKDRPTAAELLDHPFVKRRKFVRVRKIKRKEEENCPHKLQGPRGPQASSPRCPQGQQTPQAHSFPCARITLDQGYKGALKMNSCALAGTCGLHIPLSCRITPNPGSKSSPK